MMSITPTAIIRSASPRPYAGTWVCGDHMSTEHNPVTLDTFGSKRLDPGSFAGVLT